MERDKSAGGVGVHAGQHQARRGCRFCAGGTLRRSRLRAKDVGHVLLLRWPVRCLECSKRQFVPWTMAMRAASSRSPHSPEMREKESWKSFTSGEAKRNENEGNRREGGDL